MTARSAKPGAKSTVKQRCGGIFAVDPDVPGDPITGQRFCRCGLAMHHGLVTADDLELP